MSQNDSYRFFNVFCQLHGMSPDSSNPHLGYNRAVVKFQARFRRAKKVARDCYSAGGHIGCDRNLALEICLEPIANLVWSLRASRRSQHLNRFAVDSDLERIAFRECPRSSWRSRGGDATRRRCARFAIAILRGIGQHRHGFGARTIHVETRGREGRLVNLGVINRSALVIAHDNREYRFFTGSKEFSILWRGQRKINFVHRRAGQGRVRRYLVRFGNRF